MQAYQIETSISDCGIIKLPEMPFLFNKKVNLFIISNEENTTKLEQRKQAMDRLLKRQTTMPFYQWTDKELDNMRYECLKEKHR